MTEPTRVGPTLAVIAREAHVSVPTVSKVINGRADVSRETRQRVNEVLQRRGYVRKTPSFSGRPGSGALVDVVTVGIATSYASAILSAVEDYAHSQRLDIVVSAVMRRTHHGQPARGWLDRIADRGTAGVLLVLADLSPAQRRWLEYHQVPYVHLEPASEPGDHVPSVTAANRTGAVSAVEHLIGLGHERIAIITGREEKLCGSQRLDGYRAAMADAGLPVPAEYIVPGDFGPDGGHRAMRRLLDLPQPPTAVFACSDAMAFGAYDAMRERGVRVPDQVSIVGFDDVPEARLVTPALTTVRQPLTDMAAAAMETLVGLMRGVPPRQHRLEFPTTLLVRQSTAPIA